MAALKIPSHTEDAGGPGGLETVPLLPVAISPLPGGYAHCIFTLEGTYAVCSLCHGLCMRLL